MFPLRNTQPLRKGKAHLGRPQAHESLQMGKGAEEAICQALGDSKIRPGDKGNRRISLGNYKMSRVSHRDSLVIYRDSLVIYRESLVIYRDSLVIYTDSVGMCRIVFLKEGKDDGNYSNTSYRFP